MSRIRRRSFAGFDAQWRCLVCAAACLLSAGPTVRAQGPADAGVAFDVRIENVSNRGTLKLSGGGSVASPLSPGVWAVHTGDSPLFTPGVVEAGLGLKGLAEAGLATPFAANLRESRGVRAAGVFDEPKGHRRGMPQGEVDRATASRMLQPGQRFEFTITAHTHDRLSLAMMLAQSNDGLVGTRMSGIALFDAAGTPISGDVTPQLMLWDAGSEVNEEPGVGRNQGLRQGAPYAGDPERKPVRPLAETEFGQVWPSADRLVRITITPRK